jgi:uncharacterized coiled-coil protein SlyX
MATLEERVASLEKFLIADLEGTLTEMNDIIGQVRAEDDETDNTMAIAISANAAEIAKMSLELTNMTKNMIAIKKDIEVLQKNTSRFTSSGNLKEIKF